MGSPMGVQLVQVLVPGARVGGLGTRKITATMDLNSNNVKNNTNLGSDIRSGFLTLTGQSKMSGKVYVMSSGKRTKVLIFSLDILNISSSKFFLKKNTN
ncbi:hypothetical protein QQP08_009656 [Theobroma cacao]|nr:hypothetical protein QQP08_009656 [Theobroma cacao]